MSPISPDHTIPSAVAALITTGAAEVSVLPSESSWFGVTYRADRELVAASIARLVPAGEHSANLTFAEPPPMKILVTGGAGFIGSHLVEYYQNQAEVIVLDNFRTGHRRNLDGLKCELVEGSILDRTLLDRLMPGVDYVFQLA